MLVRIQTEVFWVYTPHSPASATSIIKVEVRGVGMWSHDIATEGSGQVNKIVLDKEQEIKPVQGNGK
jgi:hypothetical protein